MESIILEPQHVFVFLGVVCLLIFFVSSEPLYFICGILLLFIALWYFDNTDELTDPTKVTDLSLTVLPSEISKVLKNSTNPECLSKNLEKVLTHSSNLLTEDHLSKAIDICEAAAKEEKEKSDFLAKRSLQFKALNLAP